MREHGYTIQLRWTSFSNAVYDVIKLLSINGHEWSVHVSCEHGCSCAWWCDRQCWLLIYANAENSRVLCIIWYAHAQHIYEEVQAFQVAGGPWNQSLCATSGWWTEQQKAQADCPKLQTCSIYSFQSQTLTSNTGRAAWHTFAAKFHQEASAQRITSWTSSPQAEQGSDSAEEAKETKWVTFHHAATAAQEATSAYAMISRTGEQNTITSSKGTEIARNLTSAGGLWHIVGKKAFRV